VGVARPAELLLTNQPSLSPGEEAQVRFLERLAEAGAGLLSQLLDPGIDPRLAESLIADAGLDLSVSVLAVARAGADRDGAELHRKLARTNLPHLVLDRDQMLYVVLPEGALDGSLTSALAESARVVGSSARLATPARQDRAPSRMVVRAASPRRAHRPDPG
jgi:hypothetical protein